MIRSLAALALTTLWSAAGSNETATRRSVLTPAPVQDSQAAPLREDDARVNAIAYRMGVAAAPWCASPVPLAGWTLHHLAEYDSGTRADLIAIYGMDRGPGVVAVATDSPAARAGVRPGDTIVAVGGVSLAGLGTPAGRSASRQPGNRTMAAIEAELARGPATLTLQRGGSIVTARIEPVRGCPARIRIASSGRENAVADGSYAIFSTRIIRSARSEDELAALVGHELAHNFLAHHSARASGKDRRSKRDQEAEADAFSLRLMAVAGYDPRQAIGFWSRLLDFDPIESIGLGAHYPKAARIAQLKAELAKVEAGISWNGITLPRR